MCNKIKCPNCSSLDSRAVDNEPLSHDKEWLKECDMSFDKEIYMSFVCNSCGHGFRDVLDITKRSMRLPRIVDIDSRIPEDTPLVVPAKIEAWENEVLLIDDEGKVLAHLDPSNNYPLAAVLKMAKLFLASRSLMEACISARTDMQMLMDGSWEYSDEGAQSTIDSLTEVINLVGLVEEESV